MLKSLDVNGRMIMAWKKDQDVVCMNSVLFVGARTGLFLLVRLRCMPLLKSNEPSHFKPLIE